MIIKGWWRLNGAAKVRSSAKLLTPAQGLTDHV
jgi:hypothetical protein